MSRIVILTEGKSNPFDAKTATGVLRYRGEDVVAVLDSTAAGKRAQELLGVGGDTPIVGSLAEAGEADTLLIGIAPAGGALPPAWRAVVVDAIRRGMDIVSGLHTFIGDDPEFRDLAANHGVSIHDVRKPPEGLSVSRCRALSAPCFRVHTVGHDCGVGKMVVALEIARELERRGVDAEFIATGQTGIMISGHGVAVDAVVSDFIAGAVEAEVVRAQGREIVVVEGQGSLSHPLYSGVTLGLLHGCAPQAMVMCYDPGREKSRSSEVPIRPLGEMVEIYERMAGLMCPSRVVAIAGNTSALSEDDAKAELQRVEDAMGVPATDVIRFGVGPIVDAVLAERGAVDSSVGPAGKAATGS